jgi:hypothetical protein
MHAAATLLGKPAPELSSLNSFASHEGAGTNPGDRSSGTTGQPSADLIPWRLLAHAAPRHSILIWLGDFPPRISPEGWSVLSRRYQPMGFRVDDPWERELPFDRVLTTYDPVAGRLVSLNGASSSQRAAHAEWTQQRDDAFKAIFPDPLSRLVVSTAQPRLEALVRFFHARMHASSRR